MHRALPRVRPVVVTHKSRDDITPELWYAAQYEHRECASTVKRAENGGHVTRYVNEICLGKRAISADTAVRLADYVGNSARFWLGLQMDYDLEEAGKKRHAA
ncbi:MAG TPA: HigA family addiction module antitoxin [Gammaproteobacteria bacterium]|nr:HigA family addiction module antitoxin [Gammaproteobacteria bacterium]